MKEEKREVVSGISYEGCMQISTTEPYRRELFDETIGEEQSAAFSGLLR